MDMPHPNEMEYLYSEDEYYEFVRVFDANPAELLVYNQDKEVSQVLFLDSNTDAIEVDDRSLVIHIGVACRTCCNRHARPSWSVFFGPDSRHNKHGQIGAHLPWTYSRADIEALSHALDEIDRIDAAGDHAFDKIIIATDSESLINNMSHWINDSGDAVPYLGLGGEAIRYLEKINDIHWRLIEIEDRHDRDRDIFFWRVSREENCDANIYAHLAPEATDSIQDPRTECRYAAIPPLSGSLSQLLSQLGEISRNSASRFPWVFPKGSESISEDTVTEDVSSGSLETAKASQPEDTSKANMPDCWPTTLRRSQPADASTNDVTRKLLAALVAIKF